MEKEGRTVAIQLSAKSHETSVNLEEVKFIQGYGIEGDRHATDREERQDFQVLLMDIETLSELGLEAGTIKEQVTTTGIAINSLDAGTNIALGDEIVVKITKPCAPCSRMDEIEDGLQEQLQDRRGKLARIVKGGTLRVCDTVKVI